MPRNLPPVLDTTRTLDSVSRPPRRLLMELTLIRNALSLPTSPSEERLSSKKKQPLQKIKGQIRVSNRGTLWQEKQSKNRRLIEEYFGEKVK